MFRASVLAVTELQLVNWEGEKYPAVEQDYSI